MDVLISELRDDPLDLGYAAMSSAAAAVALNAKTRVVYGEASLVEVCRELIMMSDSSGRFVWDAVRDAAESADHPGRDLARRLIFLFDGQLPINWAGTSATALIAASVQAGFFSDKQAQALKDTGKRLISRAEELGYGWIYPGDVERARETINGQ